MDSPINPRPHQRCAAVSTPMARPSATMAAVHIPAATMSDTHCAIGTSMRPPRRWVHHKMTAAIVVCPATLEITAPQAPNPGTRARAVAMFTATPAAAATAGGRNCPAPIQKVTQTIPAVADNNASAWIGTKTAA